MFVLLFLTYRHRLVILGVDVRDSFVFVDVKKKKLRGKIWERPHTLLKHGLYVTQQVLGKGPGLFNSSPILVKRERKKKIRAICCALTIFLCISLFFNISR